MPEPSQTTQDEAGVTRTPTGTIVDQSPSPTSTQPTSDQPKSTEAPKAPTTAQPTDSKTKAPTDGKPAKSLLGEESSEKGAPENYEEFKVPEGFTLDGEVASQATALFKKLDLSQAGAQELIDFYTQHTKEAFEAPINHYLDTRNQWREDINRDPEIGGSKLNGVKGSISKLMDSFGSTKAREEFLEAMNYTGAGDHPAVVRALYRLSQLLTEGGAVRGNGPSGEGQRLGSAAEPSAAQAMYPHLPSNR